jgi:thioredoxin 1
MFKKVFPWFVIIILIALLVGLFMMKDNLNTHLSKMMKAQAGSEISSTGEAFIDSAFNYAKNGQSFRLTFLEFGANCPACKRMETVMAEIRAKYPQKVNIVFLNILLPENQNLIKYFGVVSIPAQVLLDRNGKEFYRHSGYYSSEDLIKEFDNYLISYNL